MTEPTNPFIALGQSLREMREKIREEMLGPRPGGVQAASEETCRAFRELVELATSGLAEDQDHYNACGEIQPIEAMQASMAPERFIGFLQGNVIKYAMRAGRKDEEAREVDKIVQYSHWWRDALNGKTIDPREPSP